MPNPPIVEDGSLVPTAAVRTLLRNLSLCPMPNLFTVGFVRNPFALKAVARCFQAKARHLGMLKLLTTSTGFPVRRAAGKHLLKSIRRNSMRFLCTTKPKSHVQMVVAWPSHRQVTPELIQSNSMARETKASHVLEVAARTSPRTVMPGGMKNCVIKTRRPNISAHFHAASIP